MEQEPRDDAGRERDAEASGEHQPLRPVAPLGEQDAAKPVEPGEHRRQCGCDRASFGQEGDEQELLVRRGCRDRASFCISPGGN